MSKIQVFAIARQPLPRYKIDAGRDSNGRRKYINAVDIKNLQLDVTILAKETKTSLIVIYVDNKYYFSESFNTLYKLFTPKAKETINENMTFENGVLAITVVFGRYIVSDWGEITPIKKDNEVSS